MKTYQPAPSAAAMATRYALMNLTASCATCAMLIGKLRLHVSSDRLIVLTILFNVIAVAGQNLVSLFADRVTDKHTGVRLATMLIVLGVLFPVEFGINFKVVTAAIGTAVLHAFTTSSLLDRSGFRSEHMGLYAAGGVIGIAFAEYAAFLGYLALGFFMMFACPSDKGEGLPSAAENRQAKAPSTPFAPLLILALFIAMMGGSYLVGSLSFSWDSGFYKYMLLIAFATAAGRFLGGWLSDRIGTATVLIGGLVGGTLLLLYAADHQWLALAGLALLSSSAAPVVLLLFRLMPRHPGFAASLAATSAYLGYTMIKLYPMQPKHFTVFPLVLLAVTLSVSFVLWLLARRKATAKEVSDNV